MNVQELICKMLWWMQDHMKNYGQPPKNKDTYLEFQEHYLAIARDTSTNTGIVFAECLDAVNHLGMSLREVAQREVAKVEAEEQARAEAQKKASEAPKKRGRPRKNPEAPVVAPKRKRSTKTTYDTLRKGSGLGRKRKRSN